MPLIKFKLQLNKINCIILVKLKFSLATVASSYILDMDVEHFHHHKSSIGQWQDGVWSWVLLIIMLGKQV